MKSFDVAISPCPNDTFTFGYLIEKLMPNQGVNLNFQFHDIEALNRLGCERDGAPDLLKFSYAHYPRLSEDYRLLRVGSALGVGVGPLLVGQAVGDLSQVKKVLVPGKMTTAFLLMERFGLPRLRPDVELEVMRYDRILPTLCEQKTTAGVIIHESRFTYEEQGLHCLVNLGKAWEDSTHLPLPLGGIAVHRRVSLEDAMTLEALIQGSLQRAWSDRQPLLAMMKRHAQEMDEEVMAQHIALYVNEMSEDLGLKGQRAIEELCQCPLDLV